MLELQSSFLPALSEDVGLRPAQGVRGTREKEVAETGLEASALESGEFPSGRFEPFPAACEVCFRYL